MESANTKATIGFIGLGQLGLPIATNLFHAGYPLLVHNRTASKADPLVALGAKSVSRAVDAVPNGGIVVTLLWDDASVESVVTGEGFLARLEPGGVHVSMSTVSPRASKKLAALHARHGSLFVEAPVFGRPEAAAAKKLWILLAGPRAAKERIRPLLEAMGAQGIFEFGEEVGTATTVKLAGNFLIVSAVRSLLEAVTLAEQNGCDPRAVVDMLTRTLFPAPIYQSYGKMIAEKTLTLGQSKIPLKDLGLLTATAQQVAVPTPLADFLLGLWADGGNNSRA